MFVCVATLVRMTLPPQRGVNAELATGLLDCQSHEDAAESAFGF